MFGEVPESPDDVDFASRLANSWRERSWEQALPLAAGVLAGAGAFATFSWLRGGRPTAFLGTIAGMVVGVALVSLLVRRNAKRLLERRADAGDQRSRRSGLAYVFAACSMLFGIGMSIVLVLGIRTGELDPIGVTAMGLMVLISGFVAWTVLKP